MIYASGLSALFSLWLGLRAFAGDMIDAAIDTRAGRNFDDLTGHLALNDGSASDGDLDCRYRALQHPVRDEVSSRNLPLDVGRRMKNHACRADLAFDLAADFEFAGSSPGCRRS